MLHIHKSDTEYKIQVVICQHPAKTTLKFSSYPFVRLSFSSKRVSGSYYLRERKMMKHVIDLWASKYCRSKKMLKQCGRRECDETRKIKGTVVLMKKNKLDVTDLAALVSDDVDELFHKHVSLQLVSAENSDPGNCLLSASL